LIPDSGVDDDDDDDDDYDDDGDDRPQIGTLGPK
jgi:hypothetical protein